MQSDFNFSNGQCFNFAIALGQFLKETSNFHPIYLISILGTRQNLEEETVDYVCIHCMIRAYHLKQCQDIHLDVNGTNLIKFPDEIAQSWQSIEFELTGIHEEVDIFEYSYTDDGIKEYWNDLKKTGAQFNSDSISFANYCINQHVRLFDIF